MRIRKLLFVLVCVVSISISTSTLAQYEVPYSAVSNGGGRVTDGSYFVYSTIGQPAIDVSTDPSYRASLGYWYVLDALDLGPLTAATFAAVGARLSDDGVVLHWEITEADGLEGFNIYRSPKEGADFVRLNNALLPPGKKTFIDEHAKPGTVYLYAVGAVDKDGESISLTVKIEIPIKETTLFQNYPNPFNPGTTITLYVSEIEPVNITIYDIRGQKVRQLVNEKLPYGKHRAHWDGRNDQNELVGSGIYFYKMTAGKKTFSKKMLLLK
jgi:hypothetical protein